MAVYREGYYLLSIYEKQKNKIWRDSVDEGIVVSKGDFHWMNLQQFTALYGIHETRRKDGDTFSIEVKLIDEWSVLDGEKTKEQATEIFLVTYHKLKKHPELIKMGDGFFNIEKIK